MDEWDWLGDEDPHKFWRGLGATIAGILLGRAALTQLQARAA